MDLALELGFTVERLRREMTEREFGRWRSYSRRRGLPFRRLELLLANVARIGAGGDTFASFVIDPLLRELVAPQVGTAAQGAEAISMVAGGAKIIKLGQKRRKQSGD